MLAEPDFVQPELIGQLDLLEGVVEELLLGLRGAALLTGARGRPALDVRAAAEACAAISRVAAEHPELDELEVNPLLVTPSGAIGLDARVVHSQPR